MANKNSKLVLPQLPVIQLEFATATLIYPSIYSSSTKYAPIHSCERLDTGNSLFFIKFRIRLIGLLGFQWTYFHIRISNSIILIRVRSTPAFLAGVFGDLLTFGDSLLFAHLCSAYVRAPLALLDSNFAHLWRWIQTYSLNCTLYYFTSMPRPL